MGFFLSFCLLCLIPILIIFFTFSYSYFLSIFSPACPVLFCCTTKYIQYSCPQDLLGNTGDIYLYIDLCIYKHIEEQSSPACWNKLDALNIENKSLKVLLGFGLWIRCKLKGLRKHNFSWSSLQLALRRKDCSTSCSMEQQITWERRWWLLICV